MDKVKLYKAIFILAVLIVANIETSSAFPIFPHSVPPAENSGSSERGNKLIPIILALVLLLIAAVLYGLILAYHNRDI